MRKLLFSAVSLEIGGIETALVTLLNYLASQKENIIRGKNAEQTENTENEDKKSKYEITLVLEKKQGIFLDSLNSNIKIIEYTPSENKIVPLRKAINLFKQIKFKLKYKNKFDFSCCYATYSKPASFTARTASENSALWVHSEYMSAFKNNKEKYINFFDEIKAYEFKNVIFVSNNAKNIFVNTWKEIENTKPGYKNTHKYKNIQKYKDIQGKVQVIYNLVNYQDIIEKSKDQIVDAKKENIYTFLNVGRHTEEDKKITRIIESAKKIKEDEIKFRIILIGDGEKTLQYKELVEKYNLQEEIIFLGKKKNPYPYYKIADCFLLTSEYEGFPVVYTEAMVLGLPIITTDVSDSKEVIENKFGTVVEKNVNSIYNAMKKAITEGINCNEKFDKEAYNREILEKLTRLIK